MFKNMKIKSRLLISYAAIILLCLCASIVALFMLDRIGNNLTDFYDKNYTVTVNVAAARIEMQSARGDILRAILDTDPDTAEEMIANARGSLETMRETFPIIRSVFQGDMALMDDVESILEEAVAYRDRIFELVLTQKNEEAFEVMKSKYVPALNLMADKLQNIADTAGKNAQKMVQQGAEARNAAIFFVSVIAVLSVLLALLIGLYISNTVRRPIKEIETATQKLARGELSAAQVTYVSQDELGGLSDNIRTLIHTQQNIIFDIAHMLGGLSKGNFTTDSRTQDSYTGDFEEILTSMLNLRNTLNGTLQRINETSDQVAAGGEQISAGSQLLAQGAAEQARSVEELVASITEISEQVQKTAGDAKDARSQTIQAGQSVDSCEKQMQEMIAAMDNISQKSSQIKKIIKNIEEIAFQTNILALNASVEAARAGAAGKGFSVVAGEVRTLASKSTKASKESAALIADSLEAVKSGFEIAAETAQSLSQVAAYTQTTSSTVETIADTAQMQALYITQVTQGIEQISTVVQSNTASSEESAAASEELSSQAQQLKDLVAAFKLRGDENDGRS